MRREGETPKGTLLKGREGGEVEVAKKKAAKKKK